ncbi:hypothetical protein B0H14DRAFT_2732823 [Mycena olivaceomarginata]|nr:hypothetical protein B0H14DRAFT_2732823 [Mycena olivaceomarginata]
MFTTFSAHLQHIYHTFCLTFNTCLPHFLPHLQHMFTTLPLYFDLPATSLTSAAHMPRKKGHSKAQNLGDFALKRKGDKVQQSDKDPPSKRSRNASPNGSSIHSDNQPNADPDALNTSDSDMETEAEIEIQEEDVPHPRDHADLLQWLRLSDAQLGSLPTSTAPVHRGAYHSRKIGVDISKRREQELRKSEKERAAREAKEDTRHGRKKTTITDFFSRPTLPQPSLEEMELESNSPSEEQFTTDVEMDVDSQSGLLVEESGSHAGTAASLPNSDDIVVQASSSHAGVIELSDSSDADISSLS